MAKHRVYLGLGTNLGNKEENIAKAIDKIKEKIGRILAQSSFYYSKPMGFESANDFVNAVVLCSTSLSPHDVLSATQQIERGMGRRHKSSYDAQTRTFNYSDRIIDIDILLYDDICVDEADLKIPHPRMYEREFVMNPLKEIMHVQ